MFSKEYNIVLSVFHCLIYSKSYFIGAVPGPLIFGVVFDSACILWQEGCGAHGTCWVTDNDVLSYRFLILFVVIQIVAFILFGCSYFINETLKKRPVKSNFPDTHYQGWRRQANKQPNCHQRSSQSNGNAI